MVSWRQQLFVFGGEVGFSSGAQTPLWCYDTKVRVAGSSLAAGRAFVVMAMGASRRYWRHAVLLRLSKAREIKERTISVHAEETGSAYDSCSFTVLNIR